MMDTVRRVGGNLVSGLYPGDAGHRRVLAVLRYLGAGPA